jgi:hypothetical protein
MASQEHLAQLDHDESTSSSSSEEEVAMQPPLPTVSGGPPKMRIKLSLRKKASQSLHQESKTIRQPQQLSKPEAEPMEVEDEALSSSSTNDDNDEEDGDEQAIVKASVASDDEEDVDTVVAEPLVSASPTASAIMYTKESISATNAPVASINRVKRSITKPVRLPAMSSPGLLMPPITGISREDIDVNGFTTPAAVFNHSMAAAGYSEDDRNHRGSSVQRVVDDMFDVDIKLSLQFPAMVPQDLLQRGPGSDTPSLVATLKRALKPKETNGGMKNERKRMKFSEMVPVSLSIDYPESYVKKYLEYVKAVENRERAIVESQIRSVLDDEERKRYEEELPSKRNEADSASATFPPGPVIIPPIPEPPAPPPRLSELKDADKYNTDESRHPLYLPKGKEAYLSHLDKDCFHITRGRYFGLSSNSIADPHFVGSSAPGVSGLTVSAGTSLATAYVGHTSAGSASLASTVYGTSSSSTAPAPATSKTKSTKAVPTKKSPSSAPPKKTSGGTTSASAGDLKKFMETGDPEEVEKMQRCILRAAVYASRTMNHGQSFKGSNGQTYPDVSKALSAYAGVKPCDRCKNNKQGVSSSQSIVRETPSFR